MLFAAKFTTVEAIAIGLLCAAIGFLFTRWIGRKDKTDDEHTKQLTQMATTLAAINERIKNLPCVKGSGGNGIPPGVKETPACPSPDPVP